MAGHYLASNWVLASHWLAGLLTPLAITLEHQ